MKRFMLALDLFIVLAFLSTLILQDGVAFERVTIILVFFLAARILALATHPLLSLINLAMLPLLWQYNPSLLILLYLGYTVVYFYLYRKEIFQEQLEQENTRLVLESRTMQRYQMLHERYQEQLEENSRLDERRRIAQEIHDLLGHTIAAATLQLEAARSLIAQQPDQADRLVDHSAKLLREGMDQIRSAVKGMRDETEPIRLSSVELLIGRVRRDTGLIIHFLPKGDLSRLRMSHWRMIYQTIGEALSNVVRHAEATTVTIDLKLMPKILRLSVSDDGRGADMITFGMGLHGIRERVEELGGTMTIEGRRGLRLNCLVPLEEENDTSGNR
ncbi:MAG TPA: sensor histidine kinase [Tissierellia bacterium]|nr:sensor histidine kinase [Tissierellia bacterium]